MIAAVVKACRCCGKEHCAEGWRALPCIGVMGDDEELLELRNCHCGSTLAIEIPRDATGRN